MNANKSRQPGRLHFRELRDWESEKLWVSRRFEDCDWPLWIFIRLEYTEEWGDEEYAKKHGRYHVSILSVSPDACKGQHKSACQCCGVEYDRPVPNEPSDWEEMNAITQCEVLISYGTYATLWQETGNNRESLLRAAREYCQTLPLLIGFSLDQTQNAIGSSGWNFMQGDILAGLNRLPRTAETQLVAKLSGRE